MSGVGTERSLLRRAGRAEPWRRDLPVPTPRPISLGHHRPAAWPDPTPRPLPYATRRFLLGRSLGLGPARRTAGAPQERELLLAPQPPLGLLVPLEVLTLEP